MPTNKGIIASRLNLTQEHFSRILHDLSERGLIAVEGRRIHIPDVDQLRADDYSILEPHPTKPQGLGGRFVSRVCAFHINEENNRQWHWKPRSSWSCQPAQRACRAPAARRQQATSTAAVNTYYDTADGRLQRKGLAVRYRQKGSLWLLTVKGDAASPGGLAQRNEWEAPGNPGEFDFSDVHKHQAAAFSRSRNPGTRADIHHRLHTHLLGAGHQEGTRIQVALDRGKIVAGERQESIREVELGLPRATSPTSLRLLWRCRASCHCIRKAPSKASVATAGPTKRR